MAAVLARVDESTLGGASLTDTVVETSNKTFMRDVTTIERDWLTELAYVPNLFRDVLIAQATLL
jgi:hypothetical protein